jgi:pimeloyl-ACP methyl ester carboxylesterase
MIVSLPIYRAVSRYGSAALLAVAVTAPSAGAATKPGAVYEVATTQAGKSVAIDLGKGASGDPTRAQIVVAPSHGKISATAGTRIVYVPDACQTGADNFRFTLSNSAGTSAPATVSVRVTAPATTAALHLVDPFLLAKLDNKNALGNLDLSTLYQMRNWPGVNAAGLVADQASTAIAVVQTSNCTADVTISADNGVGLLPYDPKFLTEAPGAGAPASVTIPAASFVKVGEVYFAAALIQAPAVPNSYLISKPITVTATQNKVEKQTTMALQPPPVVLVHGLWGDETSLQDVQTYLLQTAPWKTAGRVDAICYSPYLAFDADTDPLTGNGDACEVAPKTAVGNEIAHLMAEFDNKHIVGGRVDVVAHSMGGLVVRHYASLPAYSGARNRRQGEFHVLVTLDTPELGSTLATYLYNHAGAGLEADSFSPSWNLWESECDSSDTVRTCFNTLGLPLAASSLGLQTGAVYALIPGGKSLAAAPDPRIPGVTWRAVTASWPQTDKPSSLLRSVLNALIAATYKSSQTPANTVGILGTEQNDVIVTTKSQLGDAAANTSYNFTDLAHTKTPDPSVFSTFFDGANQNVEESASVDRLTGCWLANVGASNCPKVLSSTKSQAVQVAAVSETQQKAKFLAPDRLALGSVASSPQLGVAFELPLRLKQAPTSIAVSQSAGRGEIAAGSGKAAVVRQAGDTYFIRIVPQRIGPMKFTVAVAFADRAAAVRSFTADVRQPASAPAAFSAGSSPMVIALNADQPVATLQPRATYPGIGAIRIDQRLVNATVEPASGAPVVSLQNGVVHALRVGEATIDTHFGGVTDRIQVIVKPDWE